MDELGMSWGSERVDANPLRMGSNPEVVELDIIGKLALQRIPKDYASHAWS